MSGWRPLSRRGDQGSASEVLYEGVPAHLRSPLLQWLRGQFCHPEIIKTAGSQMYQPNRQLFADAHALRREAEDSSARAVRIANRAQLSLPEVSSDGPESDPLSEAKRLVKLAEQADDVQLLDIVDAALAERNDPTMARWSSNEHRWQRPNTPKDLEAILHYGGSAYRVNDRGDVLEQRVPDVIRTAIRHAAESSTSSLAHMEAAWRAAYGRHPTPTVAYAEAVKAIEAAILPVVLPDDPKATLGKAIAHLRNNTAKWELVISDAHGAPAEIAPLVSLLGLVWNGHRDRHAGTPTAVPVSTEAAEMAVHAAAMIVYWMSRNGLRPRT